MLFPMENIRTADTPLHVSTILPICSNRVKHNFGNFGNLSEAFYLYITLAFRLDMETGMM